MWNDILAAQLRQPMGEMAAGEPALDLEQLERWLEIQFS